MRAGLAALSAGHAVPDLAAGLNPLGPDANLTFTSAAWTITLDPSTGIVQPREVLIAYPGPSHAFSSPHIV